MAAAACEGTDDSEAEAASVLRRRENDEPQLAREASAAAGPAVCRGAGATSDELEGVTWNDVVRRRASKLAIPSPAASGGGGAAVVAVVVRMGPSTPALAGAPGSSSADGAVMAVVGTALFALPPAPPKAGSRGAE